MPAKPIAVTRQPGTLGDRMLAAPAKPNSKRHPHGNLGKYLHKPKGAK